MEPNYAVKLIKIGKKKKGTKKVRYLQKLSKEVICWGLSQYQCVGLCEHPLVIQLEVLYWQFPWETKDLQSQIPVTRPSWRDRRSQRNHQKLNSLIARCWQAKGRLPNQQTMFADSSSVNATCVEGSLPIDMPALERESSGYSETVRLFSYQLFLKQRQHLGQMYPDGESMGNVSSQAFTGDTYNFMVAFCWDFETHSEVTGKTVAQSQSTSEFTLLQQYF